VIFKGKKLNITDSETFDMLHSQLNSLDNDLSTQLSIFKLSEGQLSDANVNSGLKLSDPVIQSSECQVYLSSTIVSARETK
jgi:hypothetical protein